MRQRPYLVISCAALLFAVVRPGFATGAPLGGMTVCLFPLVDLTPAGTLGEYAKVISDDLGVELQQAGVPMVAAAHVQEVVTSRGVSPRDLLAPRAAASSARAAGGDIAVNGFIALEDDTLKVSLRAYDARSGVLLAGLLKDLRFDISLYAFLWEAVSEMLAQAVPAPPAVALPPAVAAVAPQRERGEMRPSRFALEADWTLGQLLGAGSAFRFYLSPDFLFLSPAVYVSAQPPVGSGGNTALHVDGAFLIGAYLFFPPSSPFRLGLSTGGGAILSWTKAPNIPVFFDPYVDIANLWIELNISWFSISLRSDLKYSLGGQAPNLLGQGVILWGGFLPPISLGVLFKW